MIQFCLLSTSLLVIFLSPQASWAEIRSESNELRRHVAWWRQSGFKTDYTPFGVPREESLITEVTSVDRSSRTSKQNPLSDLYESAGGISRQVCPVLINHDKPVSRISSRFLFDDSNHDNEHSLPTELGRESVQTLHAVESSPRIVGGRFASKNLVRSAVAFYNANLTKFFCTGALLSPRWVITAAHCKVKIGQFVSLGSTQAGRNGFLFSVTRVFSHPKNQNKKTGVLNDIAVVEILGGALPISKFLELNDDPNVPIGNSPVRALGFGRISLKNNLFDPKPLALRQVDMTVAPAAICRQIYTSLNFTVFSKMHICAGIPSGSCNVCKGDSGGPLLMYKNGQPVIVGIASYGAIGCGVAGIPNVFTRVSEYMKWLKSTPAVFFTNKGVFGVNIKKCRFGQFVFSVNRKIRFCRDCPFNQVSKGGSTKSCTQCPRGLVRSTVDGRKCTCIGRLARGRGLKNGICTVCAPGTFSGTNNKFCLLCQPGTFSSRKKRSVCVPCSANTFSDKRGATFCKRCPQGTFSGPGAKGCRK